MFSPLIGSSQFSGITPQISTGVSQIMPGISGMPLPALPAAIPGLDRLTAGREAASLLQNPAAPLGSLASGAPSELNASSLQNNFSSILQCFLQLLQGLGLNGAGGGAQANAGGGGGAQANTGGGGGAVDNSPVAGRPNGQAEVTNTFGAPGTNQTTVQMPAGPGGKMISVTCNAKIAGKMKAAFEEIKASGLSNCIKSFDGCFNNRNKRGGSSKSTHAWGIAFDVNAGSNPMGRSTMTGDQQKIAAIFKKHGFYQLPNDPMHFQYCTGI
ncbi:MAG: M15 family metallopeptidase [Candidatus Xenobiia bacterium LiM19]